MGHGEIGPTKLRAHFLKGSIITWEHKGIYSTDVGLPILWKLSQLLTYLAASLKILCQ